MRRLRPRMLAWMPVAAATLACAAPACKPGDIVPGLLGGVKPTPTEVAWEATPNPESLPTAISTAMVLASATPARMVLSIDVYQRYSHLTMAAGPATLLASPGD